MNLFAFFAGGGVGKWAGDMLHGMEWLCNFYINELS